MFGFGNRKAGDNKNIFVDAYGVVRTVPGALPAATAGGGLALDTTGGATPQLIDVNRGGMLLAPGGFEQSQRQLGLQQAADERAKLARLTEDDYKFLTQVEKDRLQRTAQIVDARQRIATRGALIQQGQIGNQQLAQQAGMNRGQVMGQAPTLQ